ncbi:MAG: hypothetical protein AAF518_04530 [Spirochaetota bacterium]
MINFGKEFVLQNSVEVPGKAVVMQGYKGDLGNGYDGQIFYFFSRPISNFSTDWPKGFDESYRAPRIGYPFLIAIFGLFGKKAAVFGMYFINLSLFICSVFFLRRMLQDRTQYLLLFYVLSPFSLGSYSVLVSDSVMVSLVIIAYYFYQKQKYLYFVLLASLAILTKEPALFLFFPLGLKALWKRNYQQIFWVLAILFIPFAWHFYLKITFPHWRASRLTDFIVPLEGIMRYLQEIYQAFVSPTVPGLKPLLRSLSRLPLLLLFLLGIVATFTGKLTKAFEYRLALLFVFFMVGVASYYHFWSVYENVSRMFTLSVPLMIFLQNEDDSSHTLPYHFLCFLILLLFLIKVFFVQKTQNYSIWSASTIWKSQKSLLVRTNQRRILKLYEK